MKRSALAKCARCFPTDPSRSCPRCAAVRKAQDMGLDLILIAPTAEPPVAKAMDYGQWQYENKKKQHEAKRKQHIIQVKELKFRPNTDDHDYDFKKNHAIRFLQEGNRVKAVVQFRGREIAHTDLGKKLLLRFAADLAQYGTVEGQPRLEGRNAHVLISPVKERQRKAARKGNRSSAAAALNPLLVEEVLTPLVVALCEKSHQVTAGVQTEWARCACQFHPRLVRRPAALAIVARMAAGNQVFPSRFARPRARDHVVERQFARGHGTVAILAGVAVAHQNVLS